MNTQDTFARILASLYDAMLDESRWPATSALIDEACGLTGNGLMVGEGPKNDVRGLFVGLYYRGQRREDLEREYLKTYHSIDERVPRFRQLPARRLVHITDLYTAEELKTSPTYNEILRRAGMQDGLTFGSHVEALQDITARGIPILSHSIGWDNIYPADDTSPMSNNARVTEQRGTLFVTAAGNETGNYWKGSFRDEDGDGVIEFAYEDASPTEYLPIGAIPEGSMVILRWDDPIESSSHDYDLFIVTSEFPNNPVFDDNPAVVYSSQNLQDGTQFPRESVNIEVDEFDTFYAVIRADAASTTLPTQEFSLWSQGQVHLDYQAIKGTLSLPADSSGAVSVGAVNLDLGLEGFSSRGPTADGRIKPDLTAFDQISTESYGPFTFWGTSAATPHVAGAAALILSAQPGLSVQQLRVALERATASGGDATKKNNDIGFGLLDLNKAQ